MPSLTDREMIVLYVMHHDTLDTHLCVVEGRLLRLGWNLSHIGVEPLL